MESKFHEDGVITGVADSFCLSCQKYLKLKDIQVHIAEAAHKDTFQSTAYVEKYEKERIRKVKLGYFCEVCNLIIQTLAKTKIHVNEIAHVNNKNNQSLKESDKGVIAFDDILIEKNAWHGLAQDSCLICNVEYSDENNHINDHTHILNLIQSKFELSDNEYVYRKIDGDSYNCLVCNLIVPKDSKISHYNHPDHKKKYTTCQEIKRSLTISEKHIDAHDAIEKVKSDKPSKGTEKTKVYSKNMETETQIACYSNETSKITDKDDGDELLHPAEALKSAMEYAKQNNLIYKRNGTYCKYCDVKISSSLKMMKEHVEESSHKEKVKTKTGKKLTKVPTLLFVESDVSIKNLFFHDVIINDDICISALSFLAISRTRGSSMRCHICEVTIDYREIDQHKDTLKHAKTMIFLPVVTDFKTEFVRELRPKVYHCGYCNLIVATLDFLKKHLISTDHYETKSAAKRRLQNYLSEFKREKEMESFCNLMRNFNPF